MNSANQMPYLHVEEHRHIDLEDDAVRSRTGLISVADMHVSDRLGSHVDL